jgi:hypothetical protein
MAAAPDKSVHLNAIFNQWLVDVTIANGALMRIFQSLARALFPHLDVSPMVDSQVFPNLEI